DDSLVIGHEGFIDHLQYLTGAGAEYHVLFFQAVMLSNGFDHSAVRVLITVRVLEFARHCLNDVIGRPPAILIARELGHAVVVFFGVLLSWLTLFMSLREEV